MKVYVITKGDYSDYHICGVAINKKDADLIAKKCSEFDEYYSNEARIEVYDTEYFSTILKGGSLFFVRLIYDEDLLEVIEDHDLDYHIKDVNMIVPMIRNQGCFTYIVAEDEEHARHIGADKLYQYKYEEMYKNDK